ncbi:MAG: NapC/NirT family cytochrome c [Desulfovibrio sp.]|jgi:nitrate/TMAO reductase-like tetraheme cytochrome c subunit|nr:NapC/NirT family cytochrome c [Desulfovibrio sp.]
MTERKKYWRAILFAGTLAILACGAYPLMSATSDMHFCSSVCHEMGVHREELRSSVHARDKGGKEIGCAQCHIPPGFGPRYMAVKTYSGIKDVFVHLVESPVILDRAALQGSARRFIDDDNCRKCHADLYKDAKGEKVISEIGEISHDAYLGRNGQAKSNCAGCHANIAHLPEFDRRLEANRDFAGRIRNKEALRNAN